jgi:hypothetical protein
VNAARASNDEVARGVVLAIVFHAHVLYALGSDARMSGAWVQLKIVAPAVALFFVLSGMSSQRLPSKRLGNVIVHSLFLQLLAVISHVIGILLLALFDGQFASPRSFAVGLLKPIVYGTGYSSFVAWFFTVLAATRLIVYGLYRHRAPTVLLLAGFGLALYAAKVLGRPDNLYEWRNYPASVLLFWVGTKVPLGLKVPHWLGLSALPAAVAVSLVNKPSFAERGVCFECDPKFVAQPMVGEYGYLPAYVIYIVLGFLFLQWLSGVLTATRPGRVFKFFGKGSLQILLLHGWVLLTLYGPLLARLPRWNEPWFYLLIAGVNMALHAGLYALFRRPLNAILRFDFALARRLVTVAGRTSRALSIR